MASWPAWYLEHAMQKYVHIHHSGLHLPPYFFKDLIAHIFEKVEYDDHAWIVAKTTGIVMDEDGREH